MIFTRHLHRLCRAEELRAGAGAQTGHVVQIGNHLATFRHYAAESQFARHPLAAPGASSCTWRNHETMADRHAGCYLAAMASLLSTFILPVAAGAVALVLLLGLVNMMRGGSPNTSQKLMRWRVLLQFVAIVIAMLAVWAMGR
jgi:hypothetical protein